MSKLIISSHYYLPCLVYTLDMPLLYQLRVLDILLINYICICDYMLTLASPLVNISQ